MDIIVNGITVITEDLENITDREVEKYIEKIREETRDPISKIIIRNEGEGNISLEYTLAPVKFERIRRITGYLVGTTDRWNNAKRAEEKDRVKHTIR